jgi:hypothetical protein
VFRCSDDVVERMNASDRNIAMNSWLMDVSLSSDNLKTQTIYCWVNKKCKIGFPEEFPEDGGT